MYFLIVTRDQIIYKFYEQIYVQGAAPKVWWFEEGTSDKISYMIFSQVLFYNGVAKISVRGNIHQKCTHQRLKKFKFKKIAQNNSLNYIKNKII